MQDITVIIPSLGLAERGSAIKRAVDSILIQSNVNARVIIVINGNRFSPDMLAQFNDMERVKVTYIKDANISSARLEGRDLVTTPYFCFLDDDDVILPNGLRTRVKAFEDDPTLDVVATKGYMDIAGKLNPVYTDYLRHDDDCLKALTEINWLTSCGGLYRSETVTRDIFTDLPPSMEITMIAFKVAERYRVKRLNDITFIVYTSAGERLSQTDHYLDNIAKVLELMKTGTNRADIRYAFARRLGDHAHYLADRALKQGSMHTAWGYHFESLKAPGGLKYLTYTRHLITPYISKMKNHLMRVYKRRPTTQ